MTADRAPDDDGVAELAVPTPHRYVVIEGPIGVGKTSLVRRLGRSFGSELVLEQDAENPFLERFYRNPRAVAFQTQLYFLFQRSRQLQDLRQSDLFEKVRVADYMLEKDRLFARITLDESSRCTSRSMNGWRSTRRCPTSSSTCRPRSTCCSSASPAAASTTSSRSSAGTSSDSLKATPGSFSSTTPPRC
jgi:hypothetical protein